MSKAGTKRRITTDASVRAAKAIGGRQTDYPVEGAGIGGFVLRVTPPSTSKPKGVKTWSLRYRTKQGAQRRLTIGTYPATSLADAKERAIDAVRAAQAGADPAREAQLAKATAKAGKVETVGDLIDSYLLDAEKGRHRPGGRAKRASTAALDRYYLDRHIRPHFGNLPAGELGRAEVQRFLDETGETALSTALHSRSVIRQAYNYGIRREIVGTNPAQFVSLPAAPSRDRVLSDDELRLLWPAAIGATKVAGLQLSQSVGLALCLAAATLQRGGEVCGIHAGELDRKARLWVLPGERVKNHRTHVVPLSALALDVLDQAFAAAGCRGSWSGFAFPSFRKAGPIARMSLSHAMRKLCARLGLSNAKPHDFRRTGATNLTGERLGFPRFVVSKVLNQLGDTGGAAAVTGVYDRNEYLVEKRRALDAWSALLAEIVAGEERPSNVVPMISA